MRQSGSERSRIDSDSFFGRLWYNCRSGNLRHKRKRGPVWVGVRILHLGVFAPVVREPCGHGSGPDRSIDLHPARRFKHPFPADFFPPCLGKCLGLRKGFHKVGMRCRPQSFERVPCDADFRCHFDNGRPCFAQFHDFITKLWQIVGGPPPSHHRPQFCSGTNPATVSTRHPVSAPYSVLATPSQREEHRAVAIACVPQTMPAQAAAMMIVPVTTPAISSFSRSVMP